MESQTGRKIKVLRPENGGEYTFNPFLQVCLSEGIKRHFMVRHSSQQNGVVECMNCTLLEKVRFMLSNAGLDIKFWAESVSYTNHLINQLSYTAIGDKTPIEIWYEKHVQDYDSLCISECSADYYVKDGKLNSRTRKSYLCGIRR